MKTFQVFLEDMNQAVVRQQSANEKQKIIQQKYNDKRKTFRNKNIERIIAKRNKEREENEIEREITPDIIKRITPHIQNQINKKTSNKN